MSLTSHLKDPASPVRRFFEERLPNTLPVVRTVNTHLVTGDTILPQGIDRSYPYNLVGTAFDYRLRYYFALTDPARFVAWEGAVDNALVVHFGQLRPRCR